MLRRPKHSKIEAVAPKEEEDHFLTNCNANKNSLKGSKIPTPNVYHIYILPTCFAKDKILVRYIGQLVNYVYGNTR
jgi:hypothetical protein